MAGLEADAETFEIRFEMARFFDRLDLVIAADEFDTMIARLTITAPETERLRRCCRLIAGWLMAPRHRALIGSDLPAVRRKLKALSIDAAKLSSALGNISGDVFAVLSLIRPVLKDAIMPSNKFDFVGLMTELNDLAEAAAVTSEDLSGKAGHPPAVVRDAGLRLLVDAVESATGRRVGTARYEGVRERRRFVGIEGEFIRDFFARVDPEAREQALARVVGELRRKGDLSA